VGLLTQDPLSGGEIVSVCGENGMVFRGALTLSDTEHRKEINIFLRWWAAKDSVKKRGFNFGLLAERKNFNVLLNDVYLSEAMVSEASVSANKRLAEEAVRLRDQIHTDTAELFAAYLAVAVAGELRHYLGYARNPSVEYLKLREKYKVWNDDAPSEGNHRDPAQESVVRALTTMDADDQISFFLLAEKAFKEDRWNGGYGGHKWGAIARLGYEFLIGNLAITAFVDQVFDIQHNSGHVFGKHPMLQGDYRTLTGQLHVKKLAVGVRDVFERLSGSGISSSVTKLLEEVFRTW